MDVRGAVSSRPQAVLDAADSVRASLPNRWCDPRIATDLFEEVIDEYLLCDAATRWVSTSVRRSITRHQLIAGCQSDARQHSRAADAKARILSLGTLISLRREPVRVAEEYATADVTSRGRLEPAKRHLAIGARSRVRGCAAPDQPRSARRAGRQCRPPTPGQSVDANVQRSGRAARLAQGIDPQHAALSIVERGARFLAGRTRADQDRTAGEEPDPDHLWPIISGGRAGS